MVPWAAILTGLALFACSWFVPVPVAAAECDTVLVGHGTSHGNAYTAGFNGKAPAQVFLATDTLITAVTIWRGPDPTPNIADMHLYVLGMHPERPMEPNPNDVIYRAPPIVLLGVSEHPRPVRFAFDPPIALPAPGRYSFAVNPGLECSTLFSAMIDTTEGYAEGAAWRISAEFKCAGLGHFATLVEGDLIFEIEMCASATPASRRSWGELKHRYR